MAGFRSSKIAVPKVTISFLALAGCLLLAFPDRWQPGTIVDTESRAGFRRLAAPPSSDAIPNEYIVTMKWDKNRATADNLINTHGGTMIAYYEKSMKGFHATLSPGQVTAMQADDSVEVIEPNYKVWSRGQATRNLKEATTPSNHRKLFVQWNKKQIPSPSWGLSRVSGKGGRDNKYVYLHDGLGVNMYVLDTGIDTAHEDFTGRVGSSKKCYGGTSDHDQTTHGTHVASLAAGEIHGIGKSATINPVQVLNGEGVGSVASVLCGMEWAVEEHKNDQSGRDFERGRSVAIMSFGTNGVSATLDQATRKMVNKGMTVVVAAGNENGDACNFSPYSNKAITVGAIDEQNRRWALSNYGTCIDMFAPGVNVMGASSLGAGTEEMTGTSVAAGLAAGAAALFLAEMNENYPGHFPSGPARVKEKMVFLADKGAITDAGTGSPNSVVQTTSSMCQTSAHCNGGKCMRDGWCKNYPSSAF